MAAENSRDGRARKNIRSGLNVGIVLKEDQASGRVTYGVVRDILTKSPNHPHGIKVRLMSREVGRVKEIVD
jgi:uncharacterized repeat protein (TIGR03833 family)